MCRAHAFGLRASLQLTGVLHAIFAFLQRNKKSISKIDWDKQNSLSRWVYDAIYISAKFVAVDIGGASEDLLG